MSGRKNIHLIVDGRLVEVPVGATVLEAVRDAGISLPTLCFEPRLHPEEACRLCVVQVEGEPRPVAACSHPAREGLLVTTGGQELKSLRRNLFDLLLRDHYGDCLPPCSQRCPANIDVQGYIALIAQGRYLEATRLIRLSNPLPLTCGRVCPHPCESQCRRGRVDEPVAINHLKRFAADIAYRDLDRLNPPSAPPTGKRVAIIGGGPAGLSASFYLALKGHRPTIFEANPQLGGMLRYGIPAYRLPKPVLDREIEAILRAGVDVRLNLVWGRDFDLAELKGQGYDAIFLGAGASMNRELDFIPQGLAGVNYGTCFLGQVALGQDTGLSGRVAVIGGGNTAMDCARTAVRLGADQVTIFYRRSRKEMPAQEIEVREAEEEGVELDLCVAPVGLIRHNGRLTGLTLVRMDLCEVDESGRARPKPMQGSEFTVPLDYVIVAVGQGLDEETLGKDALASLLERSKRRTIKSDYLSGVTSQEGVFAAGDLVSGPATVVEAIGGGRRAAEAMDRWLAGWPTRPELPFVFSKGTLQEVDEANFSAQTHLPRAAMTVLTPQDRKMDFSEVESGLSEEQALAEAARCLACGCQAAHDCRLREIASEVGLHGVVNNTKPSQTPGIRSEHPYVIIEDGKCIVCRRCENACAEYHGRAAVRVEVERADDLGRPRAHRVKINDQCDGCGLCISLCPTGALSYQRNQAQPLVLPLEWRESVCHLCPLTCRVKAGSFGGHLVRVEGAQAPPNFGHLCRRGRYELVEAHASATRILTPLVRGNDGLEPADWGEALDRAARTLANLRQRHGAQCLGGLTFGRASLEELYLFGKLVRLGLGSNHLDYLDPGEERPVSGRLLAGLPAGVSLFSLAGLERSGLVVAVGSGLSRDIPLLESALCRQKAAGGRLALLGRDPDLGHLADLKSDTDFRAALGMALDVAQDVTLEQEDGLPPPKLGSVLILVREAEVDHISMPALTALIDQVRGQAHVGLALVPRVPSVMALRRAGISPAHYPSHRPLNPGSLAVMRRAVGRPLPDEPGLGAEGILQAIEEGGLKGLILQAGHNPTREPASARLVEAAGRLEILVVLASHEDPLTRAASVVLPTQLCLEKAGTFRGLDGSRYEAAPAALAPDGMWDGLKVLAGLLYALGGPAGADDAVGVQSELIVLDQLFAEAR